VSTSAALCSTTSVRLMRDAFLFVGRGRRRQPPYDAG
jgi:hypothetical protein